MSSLLGGAELQDLGGAEIGHFDGVVGVSIRLAGLTSRCTMLRS